MQFDASMAAIAICCGLLIGTIRGAEGAGGGLSCKDEAGKSVDWFYMYKLPKHYAADPHAPSSAGYTYMYLTSTQHTAWQFGSVLVNETNSLPGRTLQPLYTDTAATLLVAYNDEYPSGTTFSNGGHMKGVVGSDGQTGFWLVHSVPKYPAIGSGNGADSASSTYSYPSSGTTYGQSFLCVSLDSVAALNNVGVQLQYMEPHIYSHRVPAALSGVYPALEQAIAGVFHTTPPYNNSLTLQSAAGASFVSFAKGERFGSDLYADWMAPALDVNLLVEAWRDGGGNMPSNCTLPRDDVFNVLAVKQAELGIGFNTTKDHSKWAVSGGVTSRMTNGAVLVQNIGVAGGGGGESGNGGVKGFVKKWWRRLKNKLRGVDTASAASRASASAGGSWICVGDINRQQGQLQRGGGSVCLQQSQVAQLYRAMVALYEPCSASAGG